VFGVTFLPKYIDNCAYSFSPEYLDKYLSTFLQVVSDTVIVSADSSFLILIMF
jgi:hypothetical protein